MSRRGAAIGGLGLAYGAALALLLAVIGVAGTINDGATALLEILSKGK